MPQAALDVTLDDKYTLEHGRIFVTGTQALVRLPLMQRWLDEKNGLNTAGFISGYRGSPLARLDQQLWSARKFLQNEDITFTPGINEDLGATAVWGSQQTGLFPGSSYDGVFGMWYGKGPGVDRSMDALRHANAAGTNKNGGVLAIMGDDHGCVSSTLGHQSDQSMLAAHIPVLHPANIQEYLDWGLYGWAMSRFTGAWTGFKCVTEIVESSASVCVDLDAIDIKTPDFTMPDGGLNIRLPDNRFDQEERLYAKLQAAQAFVKANSLDRLATNPKTPKLGILTTGKSYGDVMQALQDLGIDKQKCEDIGIRIGKIGLVWPLERSFITAFAKGVDNILVIEEKRDLIEEQAKAILFETLDKKPHITGKFDAKGKQQLQSHGELTTADVARVIATHIKDFHSDDATKYHLARLKQTDDLLESTTTAANRLPYYCAGCPHNTSTKVPEGSRAIAGIGCHFMVQWMNRNSNIITHMGGEGVNWIGHAPFTDEKHVFTNLGDGTYYHSGSLAVRASVAAGVNITYKILYNDAVAMTGGQPVEGPHGHPLSVAQISRQMHAEGVSKIIVMSEEVEKYNNLPDEDLLAPGTIVRHRDDLNATQQELKNTKGTSILIYDQTCAAEKRRRRKRGQFPDPDKRVFINESVCEGCGDCSVKSNCVAVEPLETAFGRKRQINQSSCNKDFSCLKGFCPSFVTVEGGTLKKLKAGKQAADDVFADLPTPTQPELDEPYDLFITGIGGTGVITIGAILGMAAHMEGKGATVLDQTGLAQKNGAVTSHMRIAQNPEDIHAIRIGEAASDLLLGCDLVVAATPDHLAFLSDKTAAVINDDIPPTADFTLNPDTQIDAGMLIHQIEKIVGKNNMSLVDGTKTATTLLGDAIATNMFMLGFALQKGLVPIKLESIKAAVELNGVAVDANLRALNWGRLMAHDPTRVEEVIRPALEALAPPPAPETLDEIIAHRMAHLTGYQNARYAKKYHQLVEKVRKAEAAVKPGHDELAKAVAFYASKLMSYKDEYEVARLYTNGSFKKRLRAQFEKGYKLKFHLAPPLLAKRDKATGELIKQEFGSWLLPAFHIMAKLKPLRGTPLDIFGYTKERRMERKLIKDYIQLVEEICANITADNYETAVALARVPEHIRGFGHVKERHLEQAQQLEADLRDAFFNPEPKQIGATKVKIAG